MNVFGFPEFSGLMAKDSPPETVFGGKLEDNLYFKFTNDLTGVSITPYDMSPERNTATIDSSIDDDKVYLLFVTLVRTVYRTKVLTATQSSELALYFSHMYPASAFRNLRHHLMATQVNFANGLGISIPAKSS